MADAIWLASIFGPFMVIVGLWMVLYSENFVRLAHTAKNSPMAFWVVSLSNMLVGLTIISIYNRWANDRTMLVSLLGWFVFLRGFTVLFFPKTLLWTNKEKTLRYTGYLPLVWGVLLCWIAFFS